MAKLIIKQEARDFDHLFRLLERMANLSGEMVHGFLEQLKKPNLKELKKIKSLDPLLDELEIAANDRVILIISRWQPVANDLRMMVAAVKIATAYERIGDYIHSNSNKLIFALENNISLETLDLSALEKISKRLVKMMKLAESGIINRNNECAANIMAEDNVIDMLYNDIYQSAIKTEKTDHVGGIVKTVMIAKYLERIGDQLRNIAEALSYGYAAMRPIPERKIKK